MSKQKAKWHVHADELRKLGFSQKLIAEAVRSEELGLFELEPSDDLVERTVARCAQLYSDVRPESAVESAENLAEGRKPASCEGADLSAANLIDASWLVDFAMARMSATQVETAQLNRICGPAEDDRGLLAMNLVETLPLLCLGAARFALHSKQRPVMLVENHNLIGPSWWYRDVAFQSMRVACRLVSSIAVSAGIPPVGIVIVLRPSAAEYNIEDVRALADLVRTSSFDIWWLPYRLAGSYRDRDVMVIGDENVFSMAERAQDAWGAFCNVHRERSTLLAHEERAAIEILTGCATPIRTCEHIYPRLQHTFEKPERLKGFLEDVITNREESTTHRR
jgi:hypothetical protein